MAAAISYECSACREKYAAHAHMRRSSGRCCRKLMLICCRLLLDIADALMTLPPQRCLCYYVALLRGGSRRHTHAIRTSDALFLRCAALLSRFSGIRHMPASRLFMPEMPRLYSRSTRVLRAQRLLRHTLNVRLLCRSADQQNTRFRLPCQVRVRNVVTCPKMLLCAQVNIVHYACRPSS